MLGDWIELVETSDKSIIDHQNSLKDKLCSNFTIVKTNDTESSTKCMSGTYKVVIKCEKDTDDACKYVYVFDFKKSSQSSDDNNRFMPGGTVDLSMFNNIMASGPLYYKKAGAKDKKGRLVKVDYMISDNLGDDLRNFVINNLLTKSELITLAIMTLLTLLYSAKLLHGKRIYHRDIKAENIMTGNVNGKSLTLTDFGTTISDKGGEHSTTGTASHWTRRMAQYYHDKTTWFNDRKHKFDIKELTLTDYADLDIHAFGMTTLMMLIGNVIPRKTYEKFERDVSYDIRALLSSEVYYPKSFLGVKYGDGLPIPSHLDLLNDYFIPKLTKDEKTKWETKYNSLQKIIYSLCDFGFTMTSGGKNGADIMYTGTLKFIRSNPEIIQDIQTFSAKYNVRLNSLIMQDING